MTGKLTFALQDGACPRDVKWKTGQGKRCHRPHGHRVTHTPPGAPAAAAHFPFPRPPDDSAWKLDSSLSAEHRCPPGGRWPRASGHRVAALRGSARLCPRLVPWPIYFTRADKARNSLRCHSGERGGSQNRTERPAGPRLGGDGPGTRTPAVWQPHGNETHGNETILAKKLGRQWKAGAAGCWGRVAGVTPPRDPLGAWDSAFSSCP